MVSQKTIPSKQHLDRSLPYAFTEHGVLMLANVLKSERAVTMIIRIIDIFEKQLQWRSFGIVENLVKGACLRVFIQMRMGAPSHMPKIEKLICGIRWNAHCSKNYLQDYG